MNIMETEQQIGRVGERDQRFNLAISLQNLKQNKFCIVFVLFVLTIAGFYLGIPLVVIDKATSSLGSNFNYLTDLYDPRLNGTLVNKTVVSGAQISQQVTWGFEPSIKPTPCLKERVVALGTGKYLRVCNFRGDVGLNTEQWNVLIKHISIINRYIRFLT